MVQLPLGQTTYNRPLGIDVASWQGVIDWDKVKEDGVQFAVTKATEGVNYVNPTLEHNWKGMKAQGMLGMAYHYSRPSLNYNNPEKEIYHFVNSINEVGGLEEGDILALDIEDPNYHGDLSAWALFQLEILENVTGYKPILYTGPWYLDSRFLRYTPKLGDFPLWLANYNKTWPETLKPWQAISIWQFTDKGKVDGIQGNVDLNYFNGTLDRLKLLGKPANSLPVVVPDPPIEVEPPINNNMNVILAKLQELKINIDELELEILKLKTLFNL